MSESSTPQSTIDSSYGASSNASMRAGLTLYMSNYLENLADICAVLMSEYPLPDPFAHEHIIVMNTGMRTYLTQRIAMQNQITALCDYHQIWQLVYGVHRTLHPEAPEQNLYDREHLTWNLYSLIVALQNESTARKHKAVVTALQQATSQGITDETELKRIQDEAIAAYNQEAAKSNDIYHKLRLYLVDDAFGDKAFELAAKIADTLDQYQMFRPRWIMAWNNIPLGAFADYEKDPEDISNPINVFIENECRRFAREKSGIRAKRQGTVSSDLPADADADAYAESVVSDNSAHFAAGYAPEDIIEAASAQRMGAGSSAGRLLSTTVTKERVAMVRAQFKNNVWQIKLWCMLRHNYLFFAGDDLTPLQPNSPELLWQIKHLDRAQIMTSMIDDLREHRVSPEAAAQLYQRVFVFGVSSLPRVVVEFLDALSHYCSVNVMLLNPCREYWADIAPRYRNDFERYVQLIQASTRQAKTARKELQRKFLTIPAMALRESDYDEATGERVAGNPLLLSYGQQGRDNLYMFFDRDQVPDNVACFSEPDVENEFTTSTRIEGVGEAQRSVVEVRGGNLLARLQAQLLSLEQSSERYIIAPDDISFSIHSCHTMRREVEVLRDAILECFNRAKLEGRTLYPRDIVVMVPAINDYTPHITAVFGGSQHDDDPDAIPFVISDLTEDESNTVAQSLLKLLEIGTTRVTSATVIELLSEEAIARRFGMSREDVEVISTWLRDTHVYWGLDETDVAPYAEIKIPGTFAQGMERMLLGSLLGDSTTMPCFSEIEGSDTLLLGKFWDFLQALRELRARFTPELALTPIEWAHELHEMLTSRFFADDLETLAALRSVELVLETLQQTIHHLFVRPKINLPVFAATLRQGLVAQRNFQPFLREKVNFCSLMPMRAVPFEHIFILGLNDSDFPRAETMPGFNIMSSRDLFERGDRSRNIDDRYLFLEALLSARRSIYFSYLGQSPVDKTVQNPSVVLSELMYYVMDSCAVDGDHAVSDGVRQQHVYERIFVQEHLNSYHSANFMPSSISASIVKLDQLNPEKETAKGAASKGKAAKAKAVAATAGTAGTVDSDAKSASSASRAETAAQFHVRKAVLQQYAQHIQQGIPRLPSFNRSFILPDDLAKSDSAILGAGVFFSDMSPFLTQVLELEQLMGFARNPSHFFMRNLLGITFPRTEGLSQLEDEVFSLSRHEVDRLVSDALRLPPVERKEFLERKGELGELPYGIFKNELIKQVLERSSSISAVLQEHFGVEDLSPLEHLPCPKSTWHIVLPKNIFTGEPLSSLPQLIENMQVQAVSSGAATAALLGEASSAASSVAARNANEESASDYHFEITLQASYMERPLVVSTFAAMDSKIKKDSDYNALEGNVVKCNANALKRYKLVMQALQEAIAYYLRYGAGHDVTIIDRDGECYELKAFTPEQLQYILRALLVFFVLGLSAPFPCMDALVRNVIFNNALPPQLVLGPKATDSFGFDNESEYLFSTPSRVITDPVLNSKFTVFLDFYLTLIAPNLARLSE